MKKWKLLPDRPKGEESRNALKGGAYSLAITAIVLALLVVINILVCALPSNLTKYDTSAAKLYSITSNTKAVVNALEDDVTIYWIVQPGEEDEVIENLLSKYDSLSDHIQVVKKNPDVYPTFAQQYTDEEVLNNSLVVECGEKNRYIGYYDIYLQDESIYSYYSSITSFDGEGAITSAIDYVVSEEFPQLYLLEGHGEEELPSSFQEQLDKENIETQTLSLLTVDAVPEEADCVMIYAPQSDISEAERDLLAEYVSGGGKLLVMAGPTEDGTLTNLYSLLSNYGVEAEDGIVLEQDRGYYFQYPYTLLPELTESDVTSSLIEENYYAIVPLAQGLVITDSSSATALLTTSESSFSKADGYDLTTFEKEDGDAEGPFALAVSVDTGNDGRMIWVSSSSFLDDTVNAFSSGANVNMSMNALSSLVGESEAMAIRSKSLNYNYLTISDATSSLLKVLMIGVFPLAYLGVGIYVVTKRRKTQNEPV